MISIKPLTKEHIKDCIIIANQQLGQDYFNEYELLKAINDPKNYFCLVAQKEDIVVGFAYGYIDTTQTILNHKKVGILKTAAIDKSHTKKGIGTAITKELCNKIKKITPIIASIAWQNKDKINAQTPLENAGFKRNHEIKHYWYQDSIKEGFICPTCGNPCYCSAILFILQ